MNIKLSFFGAAKNVTGSRYLLEANNTRTLIDCGMYQERDYRDRNWEPFPVDPSTIDTVLLTHAHVDHCGFLPKLVKDGFIGDIFCTSATAEIAEIVLMDSAKLQAEDAQYKKKRHKREGRVGPYPLIPLYTVDDAKDTVRLFRGVQYNKETNITNNINATFYDAGHILGSAMIKIIVNEGDEKRSILFSGDIGRPNKVILNDPTLFDEADYVIMESTYGNRHHQEIDDIDDNLEDVINETHQAGGNIIIPSFAIERSQELLYELNLLLIEKRIQPLLVFVDSPMANKVTKVFQNHPELFDEEMRDLLNDNHSPFSFGNLKYVNTVQESKAVNNIRGTSIVIAGSGMCTGGRIKHHIVNNINNPASTLLFVGYQAMGTLGRIILDGAKELRLFGKIFPMKMKVKRIEGFSAHAGKNELFDWVTNIKKAPRRVFITHGEESAAMHFSKYLQEKIGWDTFVPEYKDKVILD
ncbi:MBL fold metallo-hydrolase RNA specificity domain-containing protein [Candidatus Neomarinimicrobiota bacterium]